METDEQGFEGLGRLFHIPYMDAEAAKSRSSYISTTSGSTHPSAGDYRLEQLERSQEKMAITIREMRQRIKELELRDETPLIKQGGSLHFVVRREVEKSDAIQAEAKRAALLEELNEVHEDCSTEGWDGYDASPLSKEAHLEAQKLSKIIPMEFPNPEIVPEPGGDVGFEWYMGKGFSLILSVNGSRSITYVARIGKNETYGREELVESFPETILHILKRLYFNVKK